MALIKCKECGKEISNKANKCIHCGVSIIKKEKNNKKLYLILGSIFIIIFIIIIILFNNNSYEKELKVIGKEFYENHYYYDNKDSVKNFKDTGIKINLDNLIKINDIKISSTILSDCEKENTRIIIYPKEPYGKQDYSIKTEAKCSNENDFFVEDNDSNDVDFNMYFPSVDEYDTCSNKTDTYNKCSWSFSENRCICERR